MGKKDFIQHHLLCLCVHTYTDPLHSFCPPSFHLIQPPASIHSCGGDTDTGRSQHISGNNDSQPACFGGIKSPRTPGPRKNWHYRSPAETITAPMQNKPNAFLMSYQQQSHKLRLFFFFFYYLISGCHSWRRLTADEPNVQSNIILHPESEMKPDCVAKSPQGCHNWSHTQWGNTHSRPVCAGFLFCGSKALSQKWWVIPLMEGIVSGDDVPWQPPCIILTCLSVYPGATDGRSPKETQSVGARAVQGDGHLWVSVDTRW